MPRTKKKVKSIVKTRVISARVTETVHELLHRQAEDAGMTLSEFAAQMLMKGRVNTSYVFYVHPDEIEAITREFAAIGNNLNQIAAFFNSGGIQSRAMLENINHAISGIPMKQSFRQSSLNWCSGSWKPKPAGRTMPKRWPCLQAFSTVGTVAVGWCAGRPAIKVSGTSIISALAASRTKAAARAITCGMKNSMTSCGTRSRCRSSS